ncbi:unnamed protein product [Darwinula stevensoni]|uniref:Cytosol aminopeptidase n=1 Tax=Darwinula stevensoni TaxID=69355 RepID=A0A7R9ABL6_9CRUS|nr:unnamed protein product [Darwinula stevensoni]CAG0899502.1 unnamed protein product [Darwinula stevensoni]
MKGLVLGAYSENEGAALELTPSAKDFDAKSEGKLLQMLQMTIPIWTVTLTMANSKEGGKEVSVTQEMELESPVTSGVMEPDTLCPVCFELLEEPHITQCGHSFCLKCITKSLEMSNRCPKCSFVLNATDPIIPNFALNDIIAKHRLKNCMKAFESGMSQGTDPEILKKLITKESENLALQDVNWMLSLFEHRKRVLELESRITEYQCLDEFLTLLLQQKHEVMSSLQREIQLIEADRKKVQQRLEKAQLKEQQSVRFEQLSSPSSCSLVPSSPNEETFSSSSSSVTTQTLATRRKRLYTHYNDLVDCYFTVRAKNLKVSSPRHICDDEEALAEFSESLLRLTRFSGLKPLATLNYSSDMFGGSSIVSSIEFDKDAEFFAIAGVRKRIKVFEYLTVVRDVVDIHYPCNEMECSSKISCISWSSYYKGLLASSDYEGNVVVWDAFTGQKLNIFQEHEKRCWSVDFNHVDTKLIASGSDDSRVKLWATNLEHSVSTIEAKANVCSVKFNPDSRYHVAFGSADHCVHYYDLRNLKMPLNLFRGHKKAVSYVKFLNAEELVSASTDSQLRLWSVGRAQSVRSFVGHLNEKNFVGLSSDGSYIACGSENNSLYVYYKGLSQNLLSYKFDTVKSILEKDRKEDDSSEFVSCSKFKKGKVRVLWNLDSAFPAIAVVGLGSKTQAYCDHEERDEKKEAIRAAVAAGIRSLRDIGAKEILVDSCGDADAAAEGAWLSAFLFDELKSDKKDPVQIKLHGTEGADFWNRGEVKAKAQNVARRLTELPANILTPTKFAEEAESILKPLGVEVEAHDKAWAESMKMGSFLSVAKGSEQPPVFLELTYNGGKAGDKPIALVGKGITFDSGGISLKVPSSMMDEMRADMGGAACVVGIINAVASLKIPVNIKGLVPLCENMPSGSANKVMDVVYAMNGKSIQIANTDAEGRLILADALCYADKFSPKVVVDMATLTGAMMVALGSSATGVFTNSTPMWEVLHKAGGITGDRVWRMPLWEHFKKPVTDNQLADLCNIGKDGRMGGSCTAAAFLKEFTTSPNWMHLDIAGVMSCQEEIPYMSKGFTGRPVRTLVEFCQMLAHK